MKPGQVNVARVDAAGAVAAVASFGWAEVAIVSLAVVYRVVELGVLMFGRAVGAVAELARHGVARVVEWMRGAK